MNQSETTNQPTIPLQGNKPRRPLPRWTLGMVLVVVFGAGCVVGAMVATKVIHSKLEAYRRHAPIFAEDIVARLRMRLDLTDDQSEQVKEIVERRHGKMIEYRGQGAQAMHTEFNAMEMEIAALLDEPQKLMWQVVADSVRHRFLPPTAAADPKQSQLHGETLPDLGRPGGGQAAHPPSEKIFEIFDSDEDGKLTTDEVPRPMWQRMSVADSNKDGKVSKSEFDGWPGAEIRGGDGD